MALKPDRDFMEVTDITNFWSEQTAQQTAEPGGVASVETAGSGVALGQDNDTDPNFVAYAASASGAIPKGILVQQVNPPLSSTRDFINRENLEVRPGDKVTLIRKGFVVTDKILGTPSVGDDAYVGASGNLTPTQSPSSGTGAAKLVGRFETTKDADGFARVYIDI